MSLVCSAPGTCIPYKPLSSKYIHFVAKDSDSDSEIEEPQRVDTQDKTDKTDERDKADETDKTDSKTMTDPSKLTKVPDFNGVRFCRVCNAFLPISMFPAGQRRYTCRPHLWQRVGKKSRQAVHRARPRKRLLASIWTRCWKDAKNSSLGLPLASTMALTQADINVMLDALEARQSRCFSLSMSLTPQVDEAIVGIIDALEDQRSIFIDAVAVLPADLSAPISKENAVLVSKQTRRALLDELRRTRKTVKRNSFTKPSAACEEQQKMMQNELAFWHRSIQAASLLPA